MMQVRVGSKVPLYSYDLSYCNWCTNFGDCELHSKKQWLALHIQIA